jgi:hypothetical protein
VSRFIWLCHSPCRTAEAPKGLELAKRHPSLTFEQAVVIEKAEQDKEESAGLERRVRTLG